VFTEPLPSKWSYSVTIRKINHAVPYGLAGEWRDEKRIRGNLHYIGTGYNGSNLCKCEFL
jgi:hypothetical protein